MLAGLLSVVAAAFYVVGLALQQEANLESPVAAPGRLSTARGVVSQPRWLGGFALTAIGFVLHGAALSIGSLTTVQVLQTSQIIFMVPLSARVAGVAVRPADWVGAAMVGVGLLTSSSPSDRPKTRARGRPTAGLRLPSSVWPSPPSSSPPVAPGRSCGRPSTAWPPAWCSGSRGRR